MACSVLVNERAVFHWALTHHCKRVQQLNDRWVRSPPGPFHLSAICFVQQTPNRWAFVLTPSHLLTPPHAVLPLCSRDRCICATCFMSGFMLVCTCYRQRAETENTSIIAFPQEIALLSALQEHKMFSIYMCSEMGGPTGNILCSLRFWDHFQWIVCGKAQIRFLNAPLPRWLFLCLSVSLCVPHICVALSHKHTMYSWAHSLSGSLQVDSSVVKDAATTNALMNSESSQRIWNLIVSCFCQAANKLICIRKWREGAAGAFNSSNIFLKRWIRSSWAH